MSGRVFRLLWSRSTHSGSQRIVSRASQNLVLLLNWLSDLRGKVDVSSRVRCPPRPGTTHSRSYRIGPHVTRKLKLLLVRLPGLALMRLTNGRHSIFVHTSALPGISLCLCRTFWTEDPTRSFDSFLELMSASILTQHHLRNADPGHKSRL